METIGQLNIIQELQQLNANLTLWLADSSDGQTFDVLTIKQNNDYQTLLDRLLKREILPLANQDIDGIQKIIRADFDTTNKVHYIVYEHLDNFQPFNKPTNRSQRQ